MAQMKGGGSECRSAATIQTRETGDQGAGLGQIDTLGQVLK